MDVLIGVDGGGEIGLGHASRCSVLARALCDEGAEVTVVVRGDVRTTDWLRARGCNAVDGAVLPPRPGAVAVLDRRGGAGEREVAEVGSWARAVAVIDDASAARLSADLVFYPWVDGIEQLGWERARGSWYAGPRYALIDRRFACLAAQKAKAQLPCRPRRVLVTFGGSDPHNLTAAFLSALLGRTAGFTLDVVVGLWRSGDPLPGDGSVAVHRGPSSLLHLVGAADLAVVGFGVTVAECLAAGVPCVAVTHRAADAPCAEALAGRGLIAFAGVGVEGAAYAASLLCRLADKPAELRAMRARGVAAVDGRGAQRVARMLVRLGRG